MRILKLVIFIFLNIPVIHALDINCPNSYCGSNPYSIKYPFKLQGQQPQVCSHYLNLACTYQNNTILNIPFSGDFHVADIFYYTRSIILRDPQNCLAKRLMNLNLSSSHFAAAYYQNYTFYNCLIDKLIYPDDITPIDCLSNFPNVTVASSNVLPTEVMRSNGCSKIVTKEIPIAEYDIFSNLKLTWDAPSCIECDDFVAPNQDESQSKLSKPIGLVILIPLVIIVAFLAASYKRVADQRNRANSTAGRTTTGEATLTQETTTNVAVMLPQSGPDGQSSYLKTMMVSTFLEGNYGSLEGHDQDTSCTICLEEYSPPDIIRCLTSCYHYFHAKCIDQWFQDNSSCPVCRTSIFNV
ncbi:hypothetical protein C2S53_010643 [Perilla frutescens var. hirtella]|uniref:RING-type E3 ubiquitin transferase n=1 Tax=Perilla frutescens var. hirtella TaxID=608512 RepID=A0AAD4JAA9_PERFH|nr:hypothetical protein C2S53_010643 [Perilla frutescens var. hirtella]